MASPEMGEMLWRVPAFGALGAHEGRAQQRRVEQLEQVSTEPVVALGEIAPEVDAQLERLGDDGLEALLDQLLELVGANTYDLRSLQLLNRRHAGHGLVAAGGRQERNVVAQVLIAIGFAQVEHLRAPELAVLGLDQVRASIDDAHVRYVKGPILGVVDHDQRSHVGGFLLYSGFGDVLRCTTRRFAS
jgi:hypothetical protein